MLEMPHATTSAQPVNLLPIWPTVKDAAASLSLLPPPHSSSSQPPIALKPVFTAPATATAPNGSITPPSDMNVVVSSYGVAYPQFPTAPSSSNGEMTFDLRPKLSAMHPANHSSFSSGSTFRSSYRASGSTNTGSPLPKSSVSTLNTEPTYSERRSSASDEDAVAPSLRLPRTIHAPQISLPQLASEVTCLFWFETGATLQQIEEAPSYFPASPSLSISPDVRPTPGFRKWVATVLSTTQVTQNVILLALWFIYKLKSYNQTVKGKPGSEYRLLTVALMLGNKFLDDNTYTNKTWAEVSGISVQEVHIMEVEFLSNMRYSLYTSEATWKRWHTNLGKFGSFAERAIQMLNSPPRMPVLHPGLSAPGTLPSPPASTNASPPFQATYSPAHLTRSNTPLLLPQIGSSVVSPIGPLPEVDLRPTSRKRSYDEDLTEPPAKRLTPSYTLHLPYPLSTGSEMPMSHAIAHHRVSLPSLSIPPTTTAPAPQLAPQLPLPASRAMSLVYPPPVQYAASSVPTTITPLQTTALPPVTSAQFDGTRQLSPYPLGSATSSPLSATFPTTSSHTPNHSRLSPSYYLAQRSSPYRPVRRVQTLLVPPPSASMHNPARPITQDQMQYHPLGRPMNERRVGHLPYIHHDAWPQSHQLNQWPEYTPPRQPVFR